MAVVGLVGCDATVLDRESGVPSAYLDGTFVTEFLLGSHGPVTHLDTLRIGGGASSLHGSIDEVRLYHGVWSADWIATEFRNIRDRDSFLLVGERQTLR